MADEVAEEPMLPAPLFFLEDEPSRGVARYLFPTEKFRGEWRRHWVGLVQGVVCSVVVAAALAWAAAVWVPARYAGAAVAAVVTIGVLAVVDRVLNWRVARFVLTNKRIMVIRGVIVRRVAMLPLMRVTDMHYTQSPLGQALDYGTFIVVQSRWSNLMRRTSHLPRPNELYLRIVEEMYEPDAVEARLGHAVSHAVREALQGPELVNSAGWVSVEILDGQQPVAASEDRRVRLVTGRRYSIVVTIAGARVSSLAEPLVVATGVDRPSVQFAIELDSDHPSLRQPAVELAFDRDGAAQARFGVTMTVGADSPPWLWIRVSQANRTLQSVELLAEPAPGTAVE